MSVSKNVKLKISSVIENLLPSGLCDGEPERTAAEATARFRFPKALFPSATAPNRFQNARFRRRKPQMVFRWPYFRWKRSLPSGGGRESLWFDFLFIRSLV